MNDSIVSTPHSGNHGPANRMRVKGQTQVVALPLNLIAMIISFLHNPADLARCCRASRVLRYMAIPQLYHDVSLRSYCEIRYLDGSPEAVGGASPFVMGLNGLATGHVASLVRSFNLEGDVKENDVQDHIRAGRIPDKVMLLNMAVRSAIDKMDKLQKFSWMLDSKPLSNVYQGLSSLRNLTSLSLRFPSIRTPRSQTLIPPMTALKTLKISNIDPLCYPDDVSLLIMKATKLERLAMHWNPRIRESLEPSIRLHAYFGRCISASYVLPIREMGLYNLYCAKDIAFDKLFDVQNMTSMTFINSSGDNEAVFLDKTWDGETCEDEAINANLKEMRTDNITKDNWVLFGEYTGLEKIYLLGSRLRASSASTPSGGVSLMSTASPTISTPSDRPSPLNGSRSHQDKEKLRAVIRNHGATLRHLLLSDRWALSAQDLALLVRSAPNLTQLGMALDLEAVEVLTMFLPFLPELKVLRLFEHPHDENARNFIRDISSEDHMQVMSYDLGKLDKIKLRYLGFGPRIFEAGPRLPTGQVNDYGEPIYRRPMRQVMPESVNHIAIWAKDSQEIPDD